MVSLYEMNRPLYAKLDTLTEQELSDKEKELTAFLQKANATYYMMLDPYGNYYTVYVSKKAGNEAALAFEIIDVTKTLGDIKSIEVEEDKVELWVLPPEEKKYKPDLQAAKCKLYVLFDYTQGVIEVE